MSMQKELSETFYYVPSDFDEHGVRKDDGLTFRAFVAECERKFHELHSTEYAWMFYANSRTMSLLAMSKEADKHLIYGMDLYKGRYFHPHG